MKKIMTLLMGTTALYASLISTSLADSTDHVDIWVNGQSINILVPPVIEQGRTLVPVREISEALGYEVRWDQATDKVYLSNLGEWPDTTKPSDEAVFINENPVSFDISPQILNGRTLVPVRSLAEATGARVTWDQKDRRVFVDTDSALSFPETLPLEFKEVVLDKVESLPTIPDAWEQNHSLNLGTFDQTNIILDLYEVNTDPVPTINGVFTYHDQQFVLKNLNQGTTNEVINQNINLKLESANHPFRVLAMIHGEYASQILIFREGEQEWFVINDWGKLAARKSNGFIMQFPGKGLNSPNVSLIRFQEDRFVRAELNPIFNDFVERVNASTLSTRYTEKNGQDEIIVSLTVYGQEQTGVYKVIGDELILVH